MEEQEQFERNPYGADGGPRPATLKRINMRRFLEELRRRGPSTRAELTRATGVAPPTSSSIIANLLETGWLEPSEDRIVPKGRPGKVFRLASSSAFVVGGVIDIDRCFIARAGLDGIPKPADITQFATPRRYEDLVRQVVEAAKEQVRISSGRFLGLGLAVPGLVNEPAGTVAMSPNLHFLDGKPFARDLEMLLGQKVVCTQEEHALCLAEQSLGGAQAYSDYAVLDISSGMGMGVVSGGHYISGRHGFAGEIGHVTVDPDGAICGCGNRGCLETVATDTALLHAVRRRIGRDITFDELIRDVASGALDVSAELDRTLNFLAIALAAVANLFNVESIFLYGRLFDLDANVLPRLIDLMRMRALAPSFADVVVTRSHGSKLYGAFAGLLDDVFAAVGPRLS